MAVYHDEVCDVLCSENNKIVEGVVFNFQERNFLTVVLHKAMKLNLRWNGELYESRMANLTFSSNGPKVRNVNIKGGGRYD
jgi:hypothetical protein